MDVKTLCLGVLTEGDMTGYDIKRRFEQAFSHFFVAGFGSIYPALAELDRHGMVTCRSIEQAGRPDKKVYHLTPGGEEALIAALMATPPRHKVRSEFLVLMYFAHLLPPDKVAAVIDEMSAQWEVLLAELDARSRGCDMTPGMRFAAGYGQAVLTAALAYVREHKPPLLEAVAAHGEAGPSMALAGD